MYAPDAGGSVRDAPPISRGGAGKDLASTNFGGGGAKRRRGQRVPGGNLCAAKAATEAAAETWGKAACDSADFTAAAVDKPRKLC